ncbi:MAG: CHRD domain-containing protein [Phycisphaerae bacterium]|nr:CHRD domain-containing protein [Gemmatimonadaceae bacterium]
MSVVGALQYSPSPVPAASRDLASAVRLFNGTASACALVAAALLVAACESSVQPQARRPPIPVSLALNLSSAEELIATGDTRTVTAVALNASQQIVDIPPLRFTSSAPHVATLVAAGNTAVVTARDDGVATITASGGSVQETVEVRVHRRLASLDIVNVDSLMHAGTTARLEVVGRDANGHPFSDVTGISFRSSNEWNFVVSRGGSLTALYSSNTPASSTISASLSRGGATVSTSRQFTVASTKPTVFQFVALMIPGTQLPNPVFTAGDGIMYFTVDGALIRYQIYWSHLNGAPTTAHIHQAHDDGSIGEPLVELSLGNAGGIHGAASGSFLASDIRGLGSSPVVARDSLLTLLGRFAAYVDVHTTNTGGELGGLVYPHPFTPPRELRRR